MLNSFDNIILNYSHHWSPFPFFVSSDPGVYKELNYVPPQRAAPLVLIQRDPKIKNKIIPWVRASAHENGKWCMGKVTCKKTFKKYICVWKKVSKTFGARLVLLCCSLPLKKRGAILKNAKRLHDGWPDASASDIQFVHWLYKLSPWGAPAPLSLPVHPVHLVLRFNTYFDISLSCWFLFCNKMFSPSHLDFLYSRIKNPTGVTLLSLLPEMKESLLTTCCCPLSSICAFHRMISFFFF